MSQVWLGIHMGVTMVSVSMFRGTSCELLLQIPSYVTLTETGEILVGTRAQRYFGIHKDVPLYYIFDIIKNKSSFCTNYIFYKEAKCSVYELYLEFAKDLKKMLRRRVVENYDIWNCVLSVPLLDLFYRVNLKQIMSEAGFTVKRIVQDSVACAVSELYGRKTSGYSYFLSLAVEQSMLNASLIQHGDSVEEVLCTKAFVVEETSSMEVTTLFNMGYYLMEQTYPEFRNEMLNAEIKVYSCECQETKKGGYIGPLGLHASEGAAVICEKLGNTVIESVKEFLLLEMTTLAYGIETVDEHGITVESLQWIVPAQCTIPTRKSGEWKCRNTGGNLHLRIYSDPEYRKDKAEVVEFGIENVINSISGRYKKLSISMMLDANSNVTVVIGNEENGENYTLDITEILRLQLLADVGLTFFRTIEEKNIRNEKIRQKSEIKQDNEIWECSVCGRRNKIGVFCEVCGFDRRRNFYEYPYIGKIDEKKYKKFGDCIKYTLEEKIKYMRPLAERGDVRALFYLGAYYENVVVQNCYKKNQLKESVKNLKKAIDWYSKAAEKNDVDAQFRLYCCFMEYKIVKDEYKDAHLNEDEALKWLRKAAENGHFDAQELMKSYYKGPR